MRNILILSFPRSGTHFLMNTIAANFPYYSNRAMKLPISNSIGEVTDFIKSQGHTKRIFKSHMQAFSFGNVWNVLKTDYYVFYVIRDGRDAITSLYNFYKKRNKRGKQKTLTEFLIDKPPDAESAYKVAIKKPKTVIDMWNYHIESWIGKENVFYVHYEDLIERFDDVVRAIGKYINMSPPKRIIKPDKNVNVIQPGPGVIGNYKKYFTENDNTFFKENTVYSRGIIIFNQHRLRYKCLKT